MLYKQDYRMAFSQFYGLVHTTVQGNKTCKYLVFSTCTYYYEVVTSCAQKRGGSVGVREREIGVQKSLYIDAIGQFSRRDSST